MVIERGESYPLTITKVRGMASKFKYVTIFKLQLRVGRGWTDIGTYGDEMAAERMAWHEKQKSPGLVFRIKPARRRVVRTNPKGRPCSPPRPRQKRRPRRVLAADRWGRVKKNGKGKKPSMKGKSEKQRRARRLKGVWGQVGRKYKSQETLIRQIESHAKKRARKSHLSVGTRRKNSFEDQFRKPKYKVIRMYERGGHRTIATDLTLEQAQRHCKDPETSSKTAKSAKAKAVTRRMGPWFDGYEEMKTKGRRRNTARKFGPKKPTKYMDLYVVQGYYGQGWEDLTASASRKEALVDYHAYQANDNHAHRLISRKVLRSTGEPASRKNRRR